MDINCLKVLSETKSSWRSILILIALTAMTFTADSALAKGNPKTKSVAILYSAKTRYLSAATAIETKLRSQGLDIRAIELPPKSKGKEFAAAVAELKKFNPTVVATGGRAATEVALGEIPNAKVVFFMVPNALDVSFDDSSSQGGRQIVGVTSDIAPDEQLRLIKNLTPGVTRLTILASDRTKKTATAISQAGTRLGVELQVLIASRNEFPATIDKLTASGTDGVIMIPDANIYNSTTVQRLLVWGARKHKSVWGFSPNIVRAGAIAGIFSDAESVGKQTAILIESVLRGEETESIGLHYATEVQIAINDRTAQVIEVSIEERHLSANTVRYGDQ